MLTKKYTPFVATLAAIFCISAAAQADDPPLRVGRISYIEGTVSFHAADEDDWSFATLNYPVVAGNAFWTDPDGRSEIQIGSIEVRMDNSTEMEVMQLDANATRLDVPQGVVNIHFNTPPVNGSVEVMTPSGPIELTRPGTYHIDSGAPAADGSASPVQVTALEGQLEIRSPRAVLEVMPGETAVLTGNPPAFSLQEGNATAFDDWALTRERREEAHQTAQYVSPHVTGYEDLDYYGHWTNDPTYGTVWYPTTVQADWAPYRDGHWAFVAPWGWTWVDDAPWGFAPFHYGRWANLNNRWCWVPGAVVERPVYAPALVAFIGGEGWNLSISIGNAMPAVGWVPLAPREVFYPYYPTSVDYTRNVNVAYVDRRVINNITVNNIRNVTVVNYVNQNAATVVPANAFKGGQAVHKSFVHVSHDQLAHAPMTPTLAHLAPTAAAREEGHALPQSSQGHMPHADAREGEGRTGENSAQSAIYHTPATAVAQPQESPHGQNAPRPPQYPQAQDARRREEHSVAEPHNAMVGNNALPRAPGPKIHPMAPEDRQRKLAGFLPPPAARPALPKAEVPHPAQHTQMVPTPKGWQRAPQQHEPKPQGHEPHAPGEEREQHRPNGER